MSTLTYFAPKERASATEIAAHHQELMDTPLIKRLLDSFPEAAMVLNPHRQIVLANDKLASALNVDPEQLLGSRPGEVFNCVHAWECGSGCGTSDFCTQCGAGKAISDCSTSQAAQVQECRITCAAPEGPTALDLKVWATPLTHNHLYTVFALRDTTAEKRRAVLERLFFHDVLNAIGGLKGILEVWPDFATDELPEMQQTAQDLIKEVLEEIQSHRDLTAAERGDLLPVYKETDVDKLLTQLCMVYRHHAVAEGKIVDLKILSQSQRLLTDENILSRVLGNLVKNALEASSPGQTVTVSYENSVFSIHNDAVMPASVQLQVFQRSFSTKEESGRGLGTYSTKLLTERYLKGTVAFNSSSAQGTTFTVTL